VNEMAQDRKKVLVLGAGYAGLQTITKLQKQISAGFIVVVIFIN
jgi:NADH dehydrogenase